MSRRIQVQNRQRKIRVELPTLQRFAERALSECLRVRERVPSILQSLREVAVVLISDRRMAQMHQQFLGIAGATDVITFQHGEVFISTETAQRQGRRFRTSTQREIELYLIHGLLHLHGCDDTTEATAKQMHRIQERIANRLRPRRNLK